MNLQMNDALKNAYAKNKLIIQVNIKKFNKLYGELGDNLTKIRQADTRKT